jgi:hypothetical protein
MRSIDSLEKEFKTSIFDNWLSFLGFYEIKLTEELLSTPYKKWEQEKKDRDKAELESFTRQLEGCSEEKERIIKELENNNEETRKYLKKLLS